MPRSSRIPAWLAATALVLAAPAAHAAVPPLLVPAARDSVSIESPAAPLLQPGRGNPADSTQRTPAQLALEQYERGRAFEASGNPASALISYRNAAKLDPKLPEANFRIGRLYAARGQWRAAALAFAAEIQRDPGHRDAAREMGLALAQAGDSARSIRQLELLTRRDAKDQRSWQALGFAYSVAGRASDAEQALRRAVALDPKDADAWRDLGVVLASMKRDADARAAYARAARLDPGDGAVLVNLGNLESRAGRAADALAAYHAAELRDTLLVNAYRGQVRALTDLRREAEAGAVYRRWLARAPGDLQARAEAIQWFDAHGQRDTALALAQETVRAHPRSGEARLQLGLAYQAAGRVPEGLAELRRAEAMLPLAEQRARVGALLRQWRSEAPDSLRAVFAADSVAHEAPADSVRGAAPGEKR